METMEVSPGSRVTPPTGTYSHPEALVSTSWLEEHLNDPRVRVLEMRRPPSLPGYLAGHIPGAVCIDLLADLTVVGDAHTTYLKPPDDFAALMGRCDVSNDTTVVVYDDRGGVWAARLWWMLRYYGHDDVRLLNGGLREWMMQGKPLEIGNVTPPPATFTPRVQPRLMATQSEVKAALHDPAFAIVDALPRRYYTGLVPLSPELRPGHIPGAVNLPAPDMLHEVSDLVLSPDQLARTFEETHLRPEQRIITYCGAGVYACFTTFALYLMGYENIGMYDGSRAEWYIQPDLPVAVGSGE